VSSKSILILLVVTVLVVVGAFLVRSGSGGSDERSLPDVVVPGLAAELDRVVRIEVTKGEESIALERRGSTWGLAGRGGYPAKFEKVRDLALGIAELEPVERKTSNPELYERLGVQDPSADNPDSTLVLMRDEGGEEVASVIIGQREFRGSTQAWYVRRSDEAQSWLAEGRLDVQPTLATWTDREIVRLPRDRIESVMITHPDGETLLVYRDAEDDRNFQVEGVPEGRSLTSEAAANPIGSALAFLSFQDVTSEEEAGVDFSKAVIAEYITWDGLTVTVRTVAHEGAHWAKVVADAPAASAPAEAEDEGDGGDGEREEAEAAGPGAEAAAINEKAGGWVFEIQEGKANNFRARLEDLLEPLPESEAETTEAGPPAPPAEGPGEDGGG